MAFWGPPFVDEAQQARLACEAALGQAKRFAAFRKEMPELLGYRRFMPEVGLRIGIATGDVIVGNVGSEVAMNYTVMGDTVNVAARLEALNKVYASSILVCDKTAKLVAADMMMREVDRVELAGRKEAMTVYEVLGRAEEADDVLLALVATYGRALDHYRARRFGEAAETFRACLAIRPEDGPARRMAERADRFAEAPPGEDWDQAFQATAK
jgi:adenylate cyclase